MFDEAIAGVVSVSIASGNVTLSTNNGTADEARNPVIILTGSPGTTRTVTFPDVEGVHWVRNNSDSTATLTAGAGTTVSLPTLHSAKMYTDGATNAAAILIVPNSATVVGTTATQTLTNKTLTAAVLGGTTNVSGGQLQFPASQSASADANTLDDYEEGTFTPTLGDGTNNFTLSTAAGFYTKNGRVVHVSIFCTWTSIGSAGGGQLLIAGLPFTSNSGANYRAAVAVGYFAGLDTTATLNQIMSHIADSATIIVFNRANDNAAPSALPANSSSATGDLIVSLTYFV